MNQQAGSQIPLPLNLGDKATLDNFWVGHNSELVSAIRACVETGVPRLVYFYGPTCSGKSHLLFAAMKLAKEEVLNTSYFSLADPRVSVEMLDSIDTAHLVCIDNVDSWAGYAENERALFSLFEQVKHAGGQMLLSATQAPELGRFQLADLISRLSSGLIYPVSALNEEQQFEAIKMRCRKRGLSISDDAVKFLLSRSSRDTGELFTLLDEIDRASLIEQRKLTIPFLQGLIQS